MALSFLLFVLYRHTFDDLGLSLGFEDGLYHFVVLLLFYDLDADLLAGFHEVAVAS